MAESSEPHVRVFNGLNVLEEAEAVLICKLYVFVIGCYCQEGGAWRITSPCLSACGACPHLSVLYKLSPDI